MKKVFCFFLAFVAICVLFSILTPRQADKPMAKVSSSVDVVSATDDATTRNAICALFENNGLKIKRAMHQPLIEKDPGLYGGKERWWITFEDGEQIVSWVGEGKITFCHNGNEYNEIPLY